MKRGLKVMVVGGTRYHQFRLCSIVRIRFKHQEEFNWYCQRKFLFWWVGKIQILKEEDFVY